MRLKRLLVNVMGAAFCWALSDAPLVRADTFDGVTLYVTIDPSFGTLTLQWTGGDPDFQVFRSTDPAIVVDPANKLGDTSLRTWYDQPPTASILFYKVTSSCVYNPPEVCNGIDDDCNGVVDDGLGMTTCGLGACTRMVDNCVNGTPQTCVPGTPSPEVCNGIDDDCNGVVDDPGSELSCNLPNATPSCVSGSCAVSACNSGYSNCDAAAADGCECGTPACCGSACQFTHSNGLGQNYFDCFPLGVPGNASTYNATMATEASAAWPPGGTTLTGKCGTGATAPQFVAKQTASACALWVYTGSLAGYVHLNTASSNCFCPMINFDPTWN